MGPRFALQLLLSIAFAAGGSVARAACDGVFANGFEGGGAVISGSSVIVTGDGHTHLWYYRVPPSANACRPVLIWLHGDGGSGNGYASGFRPYTDADGAILVTPSGENQTWTHAADDLPGEPQDSQFLSLMIESLVASGVEGVQVDPERIYLGGDSRGAYMPYFLLMRPSTKARLAAVAVNAGLLYCQDGDLDCNTDEPSPQFHDSGAAILHLHGTNDTSVEPPPTATFHSPIDWNIDWRVFFPMKLWAGQHGCFLGDNSTGQDDGVLRESYTANGHPAAVYDLTDWSAACARYQLILVTDGGHVIGGQYQRIWNFLKAHRLGEF